MSKKIIKKTPRTRSVRQKVIFAVAAILLMAIIILGGVQLSFIFFFNKQVKEYLQTEMVKQTRGEYKITIKQLSTNLFNQSVCLSGVVLTADRKIKPDSPKYFATAKKIKLLDFKVFAYVFNNNLCFDELKFIEPSGKIYKGKKPTEENSEKFSSYKMISKHLHSLSIENILVRNATINFYDAPTDTLPALRTRNNVLNISNLRIDEESHKLGRLFLADSIGLTIHKFDYKTKSTLYTVRVKKLVATSTDSTMTFDSIQLIPNYNKHDFGYKAGKQTDRMSISVYSMRFEKIDVRSFFENNAFIAKKVYADRFMLEAYRDKNVEAQPKPAKSLQRMLRDVPFLVQVDEIHIKNAQVVYAEVPKGAVDPGAISFNKINGLLRGVNNDSARITEKSMLVLDATCLFMNEGQMLAHYGFPLKTDSMVFDCSGKMTSFRLESLNPVLEPLAYLSIKQGWLDTLIFNFHATSQKSKGKMELRYHDLKIKLLKNDDKKSGKIKDFLTLPSKRLLAAILVKDDNPKKNKEVRITEIEEKRNPYKFIFNYSWKSILSGIKPAVGMPSKTKQIKEPPPE